MTFAGVTNSDPDANVCSMGIVDSKKNRSN